MNCTVQYVQLHDGIRGVLDVCTDIYGREKSKRSN